VKGKDESTVDQNLDHRTSISLSSHGVQPTRYCFATCPPPRRSDPLVVCYRLRLTNLNHTLARKHVEGGEENGGRLTRDRSSLP